MVELKIWIIPVAALIPMIMGFIWYNPKTLGTAWMKEAGITEETMKDANMGVIFGLSFVFACLMAFSMMGMTIHQMGLQSLVMGADQSTMDLAQQVYDATKSNYRTFGHGALHGFFAGITFAFVVLATNAMFERKSWKYIWINAGYWIITMALMGGVICQFA